MDSGSNIEATRESRSNLNRGSRADGNWLSAPEKDKRERVSSLDIAFRYGWAVRHFLRGAVQLHVLHHAAEREVDGAWMSDELARHGYRISPGTLYPTLHRMEAEGLLESRAELVDGRRRRRYRATDTGRRVLAETKRALRELAEEVLE